MYPLNWSPLLRWSHSLKSSQEVHLGMVWWRERGWQGALGRQQYFGRGGRLWAGNIETGVLESGLRYGPVGPFCLSFLICEMGLTRRDQSDL